MNQQFFDLKETDKLLNFDVADDCKLLLVKIAMDFSHPISGLFVGQAYLMPRPELH